MSCNTCDKFAIKISVIKKSHLIEAMVQDADVGISADHLSHLFERFYKLDRFCWDVCTGLSLAIVQRLIEAHSREGARKGKGRRSNAFPLPKQQKTSFSLR